MQTLVYWVARAVIGLIQAAPIEWVARLGRAGGALAYGLDARHRKVARDNLELCFPERSAAERRSILREHFRRLGENYACAVKTAGMAEEEILARCEIRGREKLTLPTNDSRPRNRIGAVGHFGNFELYAHLTHWVPEYRAATTYRALPQARLNQLMEELRQRSGCQYFERRRDAKELVRALRRGGLFLGLLSDQHAGRKGVLGKFFGMDAWTTPAPAVFALRYAAPLNPIICFRAGLARWRFEIGDEIPLRENGRARSAEAIMADVNAQFEAAIRRDPANWFWVHRRWRNRVTTKS